MPSAPAIRPLPHRAMHGRAGMTLFEIAISLLLVAFSIVSVMMLFPMGIKAQVLSRYQVYASAKALEMIDAYNGFPTANPSLESEAPNPWDVSTGRSNQAHDLERRLASYRFGILPLPPTIAVRLESDQDEIRDILAEGGQLYYSQPLATTGFMETGMPGAPPNEAQRLVFAVTGYAQSNAITMFPWKAWPYHIPFPSPPLHGTHGSEPGFSEPANALTTWGGKRGILFEDSFDPDMRQVFAVTVTTGADQGEYGYRNHQQVQDAESAKRYCRAALWYCARKGLATDLYDRIDPLLDFPTATLEEERWKLVQGLRFLSHATTCLTTYFTKSALDTGVSIEPVDLLGDGTAAPALLVTTDKIIALHESGLNLAMRFAASHPYDWAVPRPLSRTIMMDHPLIEYDLFSPPLSGTIFKAGISAEQWRPVAAQPIRHIGSSFQFSNMPVPSTDARWRWWGNGQAPSPPGVGGFAPDQPSSFWGRREHFTLTNAFTADERCRQIVFWAVDWMSYEDAETAPSAPVDAARYPRGAPRGTWGNEASFERLMLNPPFFDWQQYSFRNPEKVLAFKEPMTGREDGFDVRTRIVGSEGQPGSIGSGKEDQHHGHAKHIFSGRYGADRNFNRVLDRGTVPPAVRMRAVTVARFNFYDLRVPSAIR